LEEARPGKKDVAATKALKSMNALQFFKPPQRMELRQRFLNVQLPSPLFYLAAIMSWA